jgi:alkyl sulfatase BDS1-like metallo-beta-lactamase superfamily hydrolase
MLLDYLGVRLNGQRAAGKTITLNLQFLDTHETCVLALANSVLNHTLGEQAPDADATFILTRGIRTQIMFGQTSIDKAIEAGGLQIHGKKEALFELLSLLDTFEFWFNIVTP